MSKLSNVLAGQIQPGHELKGCGKSVGGASRRTQQQKSGDQEVDPQLEKK